MPKRDVEDFISHWKGATAPEQSISQQFLCELCDLLDVPQPGNQRNGAYTFEFHVSETQHDGTTKEGRIDLYKRAHFVLESKKFQEKVAEQTGLELAAEQMSAATSKVLSLAFAIPDHPWVDTVDGAAVRIAMTVGEPGEHAGELLEIKTETEQADGSAKVAFDTKRGKISADLTIGTNVAAASPLKANERICYQGMNLVGEGFRITEENISRLGFNLSKLPPVIKAYQKGKELVQGGSSGWVIDCYGFDADKLREKFPSVYQQLLIAVKPERDHNNRDSRRKNWWLFGEPVGKLRAALVGLKRYIATIETSKFKPFVFLDAHIIPDHKLYAIATDDSFVLGILSSRVHGAWATAAGGTLEDRPTWTNTTCFLPFPFPLCGEREKARIRELAEALDAHRKQVQAKHGVTLTGLYNVLEKIRSFESAGRKCLGRLKPEDAGKICFTLAMRQLDEGEPIAAGQSPLTEKEKFIYEKGLVAVLKQLHDDLDAAVSAAYGWPNSLTDAEILERLVALNAERAEEEKRGVIHWLRPEYQAKGQQQIKLEAKPEKKAKSKAAPAKRKGKTAWPKTLPERMHAVETALHAAAAPIAPADLAAQFARAKPADVAEILKTLETFGRARKAGEGKFKT